LDARATGAGDLRRYRGVAARGVRWRPNTPTAALVTILEARMKLVRQMLHGKTPLISISPTATVYDALALMAQHDVGAVVVLDDGELAGVFSERDYARKVILHGKASKELTVSEVMTSRVLIVGLDDSVEACMALMTDKRVRHLPVMDQDAVVGIVSIGDVVKALLHEQQFLITQLERYITA
jgi:CBS domain-containing protein